MVLRSRRLDVVLREVREELSSYPHCRIASLFLQNSISPFFLISIYLPLGDQDDSLTAKTVRIQAGQWKGYLGTVSHTTATHVQVELHSRLKKVMVVKERVHVIGDKFGATDNGDGTNSMSAGAPSASFMGAATPMHGGATPMHGGATPMHGGATPMHDGYGCVLLTFMHLLHLMF